MRQNLTDINLEDFFCMKYAQIIKNLELNQNKEPFDFLLFPHTVKKLFLISIFMQKVKLLT